MAKDASAVGLVSLSRKWFETDSNKDVREIDVLEDKRGADPVREIQRKDLKELITKGLSRAERLIIILYYFEEMTMKEIGATLDLSRIARQPDAQQHPRAAQGADGGPRRRNFSRRRRCEPCVATAAKSVSGQSRPPLCCRVLKRIANLLHRIRGQRPLLRRRDVRPRVVRIGRADDRRMHARLRQRKSHAISAQSRSLSNPGARCHRRSPGSQTA